MLSPRNLSRLQLYHQLRQVTIRCQRYQTFGTASRPEIYDVVCVGGGPAGLSLLTSLRASKSTRHLKVALVDAQDLNQVRNWHLPPDQYSNRASSLTPASIAYLTKIGVWPHLDTSRVQPYSHMRVWDGLSSTGRISFDIPGHGPGMGYMTENQNLTRAFLLRLDELQGLDIFDKNKIGGIRLGNPSKPESEPHDGSLDLSSYPHVDLTSGRTLAARLLVGADGLNSPVRKFADISTRGWDYGRHGVVATLRMTDHNISKTESATAYQRFLPTGPIALLPLPDNYASLVWTTTPERAAHLKSLSTTDFVASVNAAFRLSVVDLDYMSTMASGQADEFQWRASVNAPQISMQEANNSIPASVEDLQNNSVASFPLRFRHSSTYVRPRTALIGDAAHIIHPLAGQGLNMGQGDSRSLAATIASAVEHGADIGDETQCLHAYNADMWMTNSRMLGVVDKLHWLYSAQSAPIVALRGLGLGLVDWTESMGLKKWFMRQAGVD